MILKKLKETMEKKKVSVEHLADKVGMSASTVFKARKGNSVNVNTGKRFAKALGVDLTDL